MSDIDRLGPIFTARHHSRCDACDNPIMPGDDARACPPGGWIHADCDPPEPVAARPSAPACGQCFQIRASNGVCGCDS